MKRLTLPLACFALVVACRAQDNPAPMPAHEAGVTTAVLPDETRAISHNGQTFLLASSTKGPNVETEEYLLRGEKLAEWSQLLTMQRLTLENPSTPDEFAAYFQKRVNQEGGARLELIQQSKAAAVFAVHFAKSEQNEEQVMVCLVLADKGGSLNLVQFAIKPARLMPEVVAAQLKSWKTKFTQQAAAAK